MVRCCLSSMPSGSSPLARGTHGALLLELDAVRFIPARAGNTPTRDCGASTSPVHPRSRGEHLVRLAEGRGYVGSSPLARGTLEGLALAHAHDRFIPARAGNTPTSSRTATASPVHPRSRGEHLNTHRAAPLAFGSSPLARGTLHRSLERGTSRQVHPRSRGEHALQQAKPRRLSGSSPLARGTLYTFIPSLFRDRFIPARAGNTTTATPAPDGRPVHPRSRGEHTSPARRYRPRHGSSPLARGTPVQRLVLPAHPRFIPARAGNTDCWRLM